MSTKKIFINKMSDKIVTKFPDPIQTNSLFEVAQAMVDQGKEPKEIKKILKDLYGASKDELERLDDKLFKNKINASEEKKSSLDDAYDKEVRPNFDILKDLWDNPKNKSEYFSSLYFSSLDGGFETLSIAGQIAFFDFVEESGWVSDGFSREESED